MTGEREDIRIAGSRRLRGPVELGILAGDGHAITAGPDRDLVAARTRAFLARLEAGTAGDPRTSS